MLTIELKRLLRDFIVIVAILLVLMLAIGRIGRADLLAPTMQIFMLLFASYLGWAIFDRERQEGALEYLFSLPISRTRLFLLKVLPRLVAVILLAGVFNLISALQDLPFLLTDMQFSLLLISLFLCSMVFSITIKNFLIAFFITTLGTAGLFYLVAYLDFSLGEVSLALQVFFSLLVFPILFFFLLQRYDMRPPLRFNIRLASAVFILAAVVVAVTFLITNLSLEFSFPASGRITIDSTKHKTVISQGDEVKFRFNHGMKCLFEVQGKVYADIGNHWQGKSHLVLLDLKTGKYRSILKSDKWQYHYLVFNRPLVDDKIYFLLTDRHFNNFQKILEVNDDKTRTIPIENRYNFKHFCRLAGVADRPLQFVIFKKPHYKQKETDVLLVNGDGKAKTIFGASAVAMWKNRLLRFTSDKMELYELGDGLTPVFQKEGKIQKVKSPRILLGNFIQKNVLIHNEGHYYFFNMESLAMENVKIKSMPYYYFDTADGVRMIWVKENEISVNSWEKGRLIVENVWYTKIKLTKDFRRFEVYPAGIVVRNHKQHEIFFFVESKEVERSGGM